MPILLPVIARPLQPGRGRAHRLIRRVMIPIIGLLAASPAISAPAPASGRYVDRDGGTHRWEVTRAHALMWDGKPYLPAGVILRLPSDEPDGQAAVPKGEQQKAGDAAKTLPAPTAAALDLLIQHGVRDVCLVRPRNWLSGTPAADQGLVDALESRGIRYGVALDAHTDRPLTGYVATPTRIEVPAPLRQPGRRMTWTVEMPGASAALYALVELDSDSVIAAGQVPVKDGQARIDISQRPSRRLFAPGPARLLVVPQRELTSAANEGPIDFWSDWQETQQALVRRMAAVRWGPGLRFFARPAATTLGLRGEAEELVPTSGGFRLQFESWLERRGSLADLSTRWALNDRQVSSLAVAARLVPLWGREERGDRSGWLLDPIANEWYRADLRRSGFWRDFIQFRTDSIRRAVSGTATLLKKQVADVPVVWQWTEYHPVFTSGEDATGLDGLAFAPRGRGREAAIGSAAYAYAQVEESARPSWFLQLGQVWDESGPPASADELRLDWNWLRELGCKGFFADGLDLGGPEAGSTGRSEPPGKARADLAAAPEQLDWIREYGERVIAGETASTYRPPVLYYPAELLGTSLTGRLETGVWWLPSFARGQWLSLGGDIDGYWIDRSPDPPLPGANRGVLVLWSSAGPQKATFVLTGSTPVSVYDTLGRPLKASGRRGRLQLALGTVPLLVTGLPLQNLFPVETAAQALQEFEQMIRNAEAQKIDVAPFRLTLKDARSIFGPGTAATVFQMIRPQVQLLRAALTPYLWIEGEAPAGHNWSGVQPDPRASGGSFLRLQRTAAAQSASYQARYVFTLDREAEYEVWLAGSVPGSPDSSPFTWRIDDRTPTLAPTDGPGRRYAPDLGWTRLGQVQLSPGRHTLTLVATAAAASGAFHLAVDALVLAREPFQPDGIRRPGMRTARVSPGADAGAR
jgi:hypothetical protein